MDLSAKKLIHTFGALADLGQEVADTGDFREMVLTSLHLLLGTLGIRRGAIAEYVPDLSVLRFVASRGLDEGLPESITVEDEACAILLASGLSAQTIETMAARGPAVTKSIDQTGQTSDAFKLLVPMVIRRELIGLVLLGEKATGEAFTEDDTAVVASMVRHIGVGMHTHRLLEQVAERAEENRRLYEDLRTIYRDTVRAFAAAIDIKDKYTQGHSERVGKYSEIIAREMGWSDDEVEGIAIAGYLHDIGKLIVERDIINAPYKIDAKASSELNRHPAAGYEILLPIQHPYTDIPLMAKYHHERLDGRGYPDGLIGDQIPIGAKIVSLADSFDAMTTDRPYKRRRSIEDVIIDLRKNTGTQFDPSVVAAFCRALLHEINGETKDRRMLKMLGKNYIDTARTIPLLAELIGELDAGKSSAVAGSA